jgi:hypothetical protein
LKKILFPILLMFGLILPAWAQSDLIAKTYDTIAKDYINQTDDRSITLKGLAVIQNIDPTLKLTASSGKLYFYQNGKVLQTFDFPTENDQSSWVAFSHKILDFAVSVSSEVELHDFELPDRFAQTVFKNLDGYSHYYGAFENNEDRHKVLRRQYAVRMYNDIMLIKILTFQKGVADKTKKAVEDCSSCRALILDLRGNHGGLLSEALKITDLFLDEGIITYTTEKDSEAPKYYMATAGDIFDNKPIVILVDGYSASASEVLAAALSEQNRAVLIGTKTFGKGTVQDVVKIGDQRAMVLTTALFHTPSGEAIDKRGLNPAVCTGGLSSADSDETGDCTPADRFNDETDVETAIRFIKNDF